MTIRAFVVLSLATVIASATPRAVARQARPIDARVAGASIVSVVSPATDGDAMQAVQAVLADAGVVSGFEGPAFPPDRPPIDFGEATDSATTLTGLSLGAALDTIARANPRITRTEADGVIVVRSSVAKSPLDAPLGAAMLASDSPRALLTSLLAAMGSRAVVAGQPSRSDAESSPAIPTGGGTILDGLNAIARATGLSWRVRYDAWPASLDTASFVLTGPRGTATAMSPIAAQRMVAAGGGFGSTPAFVGPAVVAVGTDVVSMLEFYARAGHVSIGVEQVMRTVGVPLQQHSSLPPIDLTGVSPEKAIAAIVAYDSRYEWSESNGTFHVRPTTRVRPTSPLDQTITSFVRRDEPLDSVLGGVVERMGARTSQTTSSGPSTGRGTGALADGRQAQVSIDISSPTTIRDVIDVVARAAGVTDWVLTGLRAPANATEQQYTLTLRGTGWSIGRNFWLETAPPQASTPHTAARIPPSLDRQISPVSVYPETPDGNAFSVIALAARRAIGLEAEPFVEAPRDPRVSRTPVRPLMLPAGTFSRAIDAVLGRLPQYEMTISGTIIDISPSALLHAPDHFMNVPLDHFDATDVSLYQAITMLRHALDPRWPVRDWTGSSGGSVGGNPIDVQVGENEIRTLMTRHVTLSIDHATPREILNRLAELSGDVNWIVTYPGATSSDPAAATERRAVISLSGAASMAPTRVSFPPYRSADEGAASRPAAPQSSPVGATGRNGGRRTSILWPVVVERLGMTIDQVGRGLGVLIGSEIVVPAGPKPPLPNPQTHYDLSGMNLEASLKKVHDNLPTFAWTTADGMVHVKTTDAASRTDVPLDRHVDHFDLHFESVQQAFLTVVDLFAASPRPQPRPMPTRAAPPSMMRPLDVQVESGTVRDVLDAIARADGAMTWGAEYVVANGVIVQMNLRFAGFDGWNTQTVVAIR